jgi:hypothetical protein
MPVPVVPPSRDRVPSADEVRRAGTGAGTRPDLVEAGGITRTPALLVLDGKGAVRSRIVGVPRRPDAQLAPAGILDEQGQPI